MFPVFLEVFQTYLDVFDDKFKFFARFQEILVVTGVLGQQLRKTSSFCLTTSDKTTSLVKVLGRHFRLKSFRSTILTYEFLVKPSSFRLNYILFSLPWTRTTLLFYNAN